MPVNRSVAGVGMTVCITLSAFVPLAAQSGAFETSFQEGTEALRTGRLDEAASAFTKAISADPSSAESYFDLGLVRLQQNRADDAAGLFAKALQLKPGLRGGELFLGISECRTDENGKAATALKKA
ncbi:MAG: tetratricopeptide repeat protein, partial [Acidobacteriia bacterium]|nr:tetratricopeptide repeat protein [Terriglobia bacterium]